MGHFDPCALFCIGAIFFNCTMNCIGAIFFLSARRVASLPFFISVNGFCNSFLHRCHFCIGAFFLDCPKAAQPLTRKREPTDREGGAIPHIKAAEPQKKRRHIKAAEPQNKFPRSSLPSLSKLSGLSGLFRLSTLSRLARLSGLSTTYKHLNRLTPRLRCSVLCLVVEKCVAASSVPAPDRRYGNASLQLRVNIVPYWCIRQGKSARDWRVDGEVKR